MSFRATTEVIPTTTTTSHSPTKEDAGGEDDGIEGVDLLIDDLIGAFDDFLWVHNAKLDHQGPTDDWNQNIIQGDQVTELHEALYKILYTWSLF